jgi:putative ABC transport system permease protein
MRGLDLLGFAFQAVRGHRLRTVFSLLGVAIGVASVITLTSLGQGARVYVTGEFASLGTNLLILVPGKTETLGGAPMASTATNDLTIDDVEAVMRRVPQIRRAAPVVVGSAVASYGDRSRDILVAGTTPDMLEVRNLHVATGRYLPGEEAPVCVLGAKVASELFRAANPLGQQIRLGESPFRVIGVMRARGVSVGMDMDEAVTVPVSNALRLFNQTSLWRALFEVRASGEMDAARTAALAVLKDRHGGVEDVTAITQDAVLKTFDRILGVLTLALAGIAGISLAVAGIGIMNIMLVSVSERTREVGLLKALGVTRRQVVAVFLLEAALLSTAGGVLGLLGGFGLSHLLSRLVPELPASPPAWAVVAALAVSLSVGLLFGSLPARRAAGLDPVESLMRHRT